ncbi:amidohydrolase family protein [Nitrospirillum viridazoti]|uniref:Amidohydrolase n=1 Tax=Nitrospirillum viridazoti CBAmc TaxID=1441467 RepID=A0A248JVI9_9PROT|nr:amidohydrolase family protein [Nitrospirillum amazonense]ASG22234.1 amidohydrolase [Nitrospirillum amazonense CBAmc]TWB31001.1 putative TIM-barrel fold metal-dependent hydrolase [Nitrospirillum amazonense]
MATQAQVKPAASKPLYTGPIFDADAHFWETDEAWSAYLPEKVKADWGITFRKGPSGDFAMYVGPRKVEISADHLFEDGRVPAPGKLHEWLRAMKEGKAEIDLHVPKTPDMMEPEARLALMDRWDVRGSILFVGNMITAISYLDQPAAAYEVLNAYNHWLYDQWKFNYKDRLFAAPIVTLMDLEKACDQVRWCIKHGARLILMPMGPYNGKAPAHPDHDPFWAIVNEAGLRVVFHVSEAIYMKDHMAVWGEPVQQSRIRQTAFVWMHGYSERPVVETLSSFIFWNFFERFPNVKLLSAENGAEWVPAMLQKMDKCRGMAKNGYWPGGQLKERPSRIFARNVSVVAYPEDNIKAIIDQVGNADWILMGSDYPHAEGVEEPRIFAEEACKGVSDADTAKIMYENGMRFMGLTP